MRPGHQRSNQPPQLRLPSSPSLLASSRRREGVAARSQKEGTSLRVRRIAEWNRVRPIGVISTTGGYAPSIGSLRRGGNMPSARDIMTADVTCVGENESLADAARKMADLDVGSLPICGEDNRLKGMLTDRDIVVKALAQGRNPDEITAGQLAEGKPVTVGADDDVTEILRTMGSHQVRRLPVIDGHDLVGMVAVADVARALADRPVGDLIDAISKS